MSTALIPAVSPWNQRCDQDLRLTEPVVEVLSHTISVRAGPDRVPFEAFRQRPWRCAWVAYWYRDHSLCPPRCGCHDVSTLGRPYTLVGDGVAVVTYLDGLYGLYSLTHGLDQPLIDWTDVARHHRRLTREELDVMRQRGEFAMLVGDVPVTLPRGCSDVWRAWDRAVAEFGLPGEGASASVVPQDT